MPRSAGGATAYLASMPLRQQPRDVQPIQGSCGSKAAFLRSDVQSLVAVPTLAAKRETYRVRVHAFESSLVVAAVVASSDAYFGGECSQAHLRSMQQFRAFGVCILHCNAV